MYTKTNEGNIIRNSDGVTIPMDTNNQDYLAYLAWAGQTK